MGRRTRQLAGLAVILAAAATGGCKDNQRYCDGAGRACPSGQTCDLPTRTCVAGGSDLGVGPGADLGSGCSADRDCASLVCDLDHATCVDPGAIVYVDGQVSASGSGSIAAPFKTITEAIAAAAATHAIVRVAAGQYYEALTVKASLTLVAATGAGVVATPPSQPALTVNGSGNQVLVRGLAFSGGGPNVNGVLCQGSDARTPATLTAVDIASHDHGGFGVATVGACRVVLDRGYVAHNTLGGVYLYGDFDIRNSIIVRNAGYGGVYQAGAGASAATMIFWGNTVADNADSYASYAGATCGATPFTIANSILWGNHYAGGSVAETNCLTANNASDGTMAATVMLSASNPPRFRASDDGPGAYHLTAASPVLGRADAQYASDHDFDGEPRPVGRIDIGADQLTR